MSTKWQRLKLELEAASSNHFERLTLPFLCLIWPKLIIPERRKSAYEKAGIDIVSWRGNKPADIDVAIQCKGFEVTETEIGSDQVRQCLRSIRDFRRSGFKARVYVLLHNRVPANRTFRNRILEALRGLVADGFCEEFKFWNHRDLLKWSASAAAEAFQNALLSSQKPVAQSSDRANEIATETNVPVAVSEMLTSPTAKLAETIRKEKTIDPALEIFEDDLSNITLVIGRAGYGKTLIAQRLFEYTDAKVFYLSAARLPATLPNNKDALLRHLIPLEEISTGIDDEFVKTYESVVYAEIDRLLRNPKLNVAIVLDAVDESIYFSRPGGVQQLFNHIVDYKVPVILLAREEYWYDRQTDFFTNYGATARNINRIPTHRIRILRLLDWGQPQILSLSKSFQASLTKKSEIENVEKFIQIVLADGYDEFYGDIPKRPLFLKYILDEVAINGVSKVGRAELFGDWVVSKIRRDVENPLRKGGEGRTPIHSKATSTDATVRLALRAMTVAAGLMSQTVDGRLELLPSCDLDKLIESNPLFSEFLDPTGLFLNSLLVSVKKTVECVEIEFAHRTYQEYFLANWIIMRRAEYAGVEIPDAVQSQIEDIENEKLKI